MASSPLRRARTFAGRALALLWRVLLALLKALSLVLALVIPVPILLKPEITNPYRRNQITQVEKKR